MQFRTSLITVTLMFSVLSPISAHTAPIIYPPSYYLFGGSQSDGPTGQILRIKLADGSTYQTSTSDSPIGSESYAENFGWWSDKFGHFVGNYNYIVGFNGVLNNYPRNFFTFDLSNLPGEAVEATLILRAYSTHFPFTPIRLELFDVNTPASDLLLKSDVNTAIYNDLASGNPYGSYVYDTPIDYFSYLSLPLLSQAVADINRRQDKYFSIGGAAYAVPEPGSLVLVLSGLLALITTFKAKLKNTTIKI